MCMTFFSQILRLLISTLNRTKNFLRLCSPTPFSKVFSVCLEWELQGIRSVCRASDPTNTEHSAFPSSCLNIIGTRSRMNTEDPVQFLLFGWSGLIFFSGTHTGPYPLHSQTCSESQSRQILSWTSGLSSVHAQILGSAMRQTGCSGLYAVWPWKSERMKTAQLLWGNYSCACMLSGAFWCLWWKKLHMTYQILSYLNLCPLVLSATIHNCSLVVTRKLLFVHPKTASSPGRTKLSSLSLSS